MQQEITTAEAYRSKRESARKKEVVLPSGAAFIVRQVTSRELVDNDLEAPIKGTQDLLTENKDRNAEAWKRLTADQKKAQMIFNDRLIALGTFSPSLTAEKAAGPDQLSVQDLTDEDYYELLKEISEFSWGTKINKFFRAEPERAQTDAGRSGQEISPAPDAAPGSAS